MNDGSKIENLLDTLQEELGELATECLAGIKRIAKAKRFGLSEVQAGQNKTNSRRILEEYWDVTALMERLAERGIFEGESLIDREQIEQKKKRLKTWIKHGEVSSGKLLDEGYYIIALHAKSLGKLIGFWNHVKEQIVWSLEEANIVSIEVADEICGPYTGGNSKGFLAVPRRAIERLSIEVDDRKRGEKWRQIIGTKEVWVQIGASSFFKK